VSRSCGVRAAAQRCESRTVGSPLEAEYLALIRGLKLAGEKRLPYIAALGRLANVVNRKTRGWNTNDRAAQLSDEVKQARAV
jgi:Reverse transcriptase-like